MQRTPLSQLTFDERWPLMTEDLQWKTPLLEDNLLWKTSFDRRQPLIEEDLWWKMTIDGKNTLWWKSSFDLSRSSMEAKTTLLYNLFCMWLPVCAFVCITNFLLMLPGVPRQHLPAWNPIFGAVAFCAMEIENFRIWPQSENEPKDEDNLRWPPKRRQHQKLRQLWWN